MKKYPVVLYVFIALCAVQLAVPAVMMARWEYVSIRGEEFKFEMRPVDPADLFRGRYVSIYLDDFIVPIPEGLSLEKERYVYARIGRDRNGFGLITAIGTDEPEEGAYVKVKAQNYYEYSDKNPRAIVRLPFNVYYMNEAKAPVAESAFWLRNRERGTTYITVRILKGRGVVSGLVINGKEAEKITPEDLDRNREGSM